MSQLRVLHHSTWNAECGIAIYAQQLVQALEQIGVQGSVEAVDIAALRCMSHAEYRSRLAALCEKAQQYDVLHIQHDYSFFSEGCFEVKRANGNFMWLLRRLAEARVPTAVTFHAELQGTDYWHVGLRRRMGRFLGEELRRKSSLYRHHWRMPRALRAAPERFRAITFSRRPQATYINGGMDPSVTRVIPLAAPRPCCEPSQIDSQEAKERLGFPRHCTLLSQFGFIAAYKGCEWAVRALELLPENYYLAMVGGRHHDSPAEPTLNRILKIWHGRDPKRLRVTGFVTDQERDLYHAATDICLAPYTWKKLTASGATSWALTSGKPVIGSSIPAFREINDVYNCMLTVYPGRVHELAWQIGRLAGSTRLQHQLTQNARSYAEDHSWDKIARQYAAQFEELAAAGRRPLGQISHAMPKSKAA